MRTLIAMVAIMAAGPLMAAYKPAFEDADVDGDGRVSIAEAKRAGIPESKAKGNDLNGDGKLTKADWRFIDLESDTDKRR